MGGLANSGVAAYFAGGNTQNTTVNKFAFSDDSRTTLGTGLSSVRSGLSGCAKVGVAGYFAGGNGPVGYVATVDRFEFADDSRTTLGTGLTAATIGQGSAADSGVLE